MFRVGVLLVWNDKPCMAGTAFYDDVLLVTGRNAIEWREV